MITHWSQESETYWHHNWNGSDEFADIWPEKEYISRAHLHSAIFYPICAVPIYPASNSMFCRIPESKHRIATTMIFYDISVPIASSSGGLLTKNNMYDEMIIKLVISDANRYRLSDILLSSDTGQVNLAYTYNIFRTETSTTFLTTYYSQSSVYIEMNGVLHLNYITPPIHSISSMYCITYNNVSIVNIDFVYNIGSQFMYVSVSRYTTSDVIVNNALIADGDDGDYLRSNKPRSTPIGIHFTFLYISFESCDMY